MSTKIVRFQIEKASLKPENVPTAASDLRGLIQEILFGWLRKINDNCEKKLQSNSELRSQSLEAQQWKNPSDEQLRQVIRERESESDSNDRAAWSYSVTEESLYVNGTLKIYIAGHKSDFPVKKFMQFPDAPGLYVYEAVVNEDEES